MVVVEEDQKSMFLQRMRNKTIQKVNQINKKKNKDQGQDHEKRRRVFENLEKS